MAVKFLLFGLVRHRLDLLDALRARRFRRLSLGSHDGRRGRQLFYISSATIENHVRRVLLANKSKTYRNFVHFACGLLKEHPKEMCVKFAIKLKITQRKTSKKILKM